jgi:hypothetical protein
MMRGLTICLIGMVIDVLSWRIIHLRLDWGRCTTLKKVMLTNRTVQKATLKVENLHYDLSEDDLTVLHWRLLGSDG